MDKNIKTFLDTNILLHCDDLDLLIETYGVLHLSSVVIEELEAIKTDVRKDDEIKFRSRVALRHIIENEENYKVELVTLENRSILTDMGLTDTNDNLIISSAFIVAKTSEVLFISNDTLAYLIAKDIFGLNSIRLLDANKKDKYRGFKDVIMADEELADFYSQEEKENTYGLLQNEYLIIHNTLNQPIDAFVYDGLELQEIKVAPIKSNLLGKLKAKDFYQQCVLDSFYRNTITVVKGRAGSGKSYLAMNFLLSQLEKDKIDMVIMFINDVPVKNSVQHGYLPGDLTSKLLDSQVGNFLVGKLGSKESILHLIQMGKLLLLPISDIRGFDTSTMKAGIYITEAQNMSIEMMKLALQRIGEDCMCIIDGDCGAQVDNKMFDGKNNGMVRLSEVFKNREIYGEMELSQTYRSKLAEIAELL